MRRVSYACNAGSDQYFPLCGKSLADYGVGDLPVVVGEYPLDGWTNPNGTLTANQIASKLFDLGYAGAKAWAYTKDGNWAGNKGDLASFAALTRARRSFRIRVTRAIDGRP